MTARPKTAKNAKSSGAVRGCPGDWSVGDPAYNPGLVRVGLTGALGRMHTILVLNGSCWSWPSINQVSGVYELELNMTVSFVICKNRITYNIIHFACVINSSDKNNHRKSRAIVTKRSTISFRTSSSESLFRN